ncbi:MAG: hypothetical protein ACKVX7_18870 [Planctomycetota bacterium]
MFFTHSLACVVWSPR